jgi:hypothetical protein
LNISQNETRVPSSKQEENETNWRNREENEANDQKYHALPESRCREENTKKPGSKPVLVPGFSTKNSASGLCKGKPPGSNATEFTNMDAAAKGT